MEWTLTVVIMEHVIGPMNHGEELSGLTNSITFVWIRIIQFFFDRKR